MPLNPPQGTRLAHDTDHADLARCIAQEQVARAGLLNATRLLRLAFPTAAAAIIDAEPRHVSPIGLRLAGLIDPAGAVLWSSAEPETQALRQFATTDGDPWIIIRHRVEHDLERVVGGDDPDDLWTEADDAIAAALRTPRTGRTPLFDITLPDNDAVTAALQPIAPSTGPAHCPPAIDTTSRHLPARCPDELPALQTAGALLFSYVDTDRARPTLCVCLDVDHIAPELRDEHGAAVDIQIGGRTVFLTPDDENPTRPNRPSPATR